MKILRSLFAVAAALILVALSVQPAGAGTYVGDIPASGTVQCYWNTNDQTGASITRSTDGTLKVFKNNSITERTSLAGVTQTEDFDSATGVHTINVDTSDNTDAGFYAAGNEYHLVMTAMTIDTKTVNAHVCSFSIERSGGVLALVKGTGVKISPGTGTGQINLSSGDVITNKVTPIFDAIKKGTTSRIYQIFIKDQRTGAGLTGLTQASGGLTWYYCRDDQGNAACSVLTAASATRGSFTSSGFVEKDATNAPGIYEIGLPNASIATGSALVTHFLKGVTNMTPVVLMLALVDNVTGDIATTLGTPAGASVSADVAAVKTDTSAVKTKTDFLPSATAGAAGGVFIAGTNAATVVTTSLTTTFTGNLTGSVGSVTGAAGSVTGAVGSVTGNVGGNVTGNVTGSVGSITGVTFPSNFGTMLVNSSGVSTAGGGIRKNIASQSYAVYMVLAADHISPATSKTLTITVSKDGGAFGAMAGSVAENGGAGNGNGWYTVSLAQADTNCNVCVFRATAAVTDTRTWYFVTAP